MLMAEYSRKGAWHEVFVIKLFYPELLTQLSHGTPVY